MIGYTLNTTSLYVQNLEVIFVFILDAAFGLRNLGTVTLAAGVGWSVGWGIVGERQRRSRNSFCKFSIVRNRGQFGASSPKPMILDDTSEHVYVHISFDLI